MHIVLLFDRLNVNVDLLILKIQLIANSTLNSVMSDQEFTPDPGAGGILSLPRSQPSPPVKSSTPQSPLGLPKSSQSQKPQSPKPQSPRAVERPTVPYHDTLGEGENENKEEEDEMSQEVLVFLVVPSTCARFHCFLSHSN